MCLVFPCLPCVPAGVSIGAKTAISAAEVAAILRGLTEFHMNNGDINARRSTGIGR
jgi:hypothetical protein